MYVPEVLRCGYALMCTSFEKLETEREREYRGGEGEKGRDGEGDTDHHAMLVHTMLCSFKLITI